LPLEIVVVSMIESTDVTAPEEVAGEAATSNQRNTN